MDVNSLIPILAVLIGSAGLLGGIAAFRKVQPEKESIIVTAAQGALVVQAGVLDDLREELTRAHDQIAQLQTEVGKVNDELHQEVERLRAERNRLDAENRKLRERVRQLESKVEQLQANGS